MDGTKLLLFGIAVICFGGFVMVGWAAIGGEATPYDNAGYLVAIFGLGISTVGLFADRLRFGGEN